MKAFDAKALAVLAVAAVAAAVWACLPHRGSSRTQAGAPIAVLGSSANASSTSRADLDRTIETMTARVAKNPSDERSAFSLADALLRETRVTGNAGLAVQAEGVLAHAAQGAPRQLQRGSNAGRGLSLATPLPRRHSGRPAMSAGPARTTPGSTASWATRISSWVNMTRHSRPSIAWPRFGRTPRPTPARPMRESFKATSRAR